MIVLLTFPLDVIYHHLGGQICNGFKFDVRLRPCNSDDYLRNYHCIEPRTNAKKTRYCSIFIWRDWMICIWRQIKQALKDNGHPNIWTVLKLIEKKWNSQLKLKLKTCIKVYPVIKRYHWLTITSSRISLAPYVAIMYHPAEETRRCPFPLYREQARTGHEAATNVFMDP